MKSLSPGHNLSSNQNQSPNQNQNQYQNQIKWICIFGILIGILFFAYSLQTMLNGPHQMRQVASVYPAYFYCTENADFLYPKIGARENEAGVAISEFPIYAYAVGKICQLKGSWDEATPRVFSIVMALLAASLLYSFVSKRYDVVDRMSHPRLIFFSIFFFVPITWTFFTIPMPESTALVFYFFAGHLWQSAPKTLGWKSWLACASFCLGFLIRPYYVLLLFLFLPHVAQIIFVLTSCIFLFWLWYRYWAPLVTTNPGYFGINFESKTRILESLPRAFAHLPERILEHTAAVGLASFFLLRHKQRYLILLYIASVAMMYVLKPTHVAAHAYYLMGAGVIAVVVLFLSMAEMKPKWQAWFLAGLFVFTFSNTWHNFRINPSLDAIADQVAKVGGIPEDAKVASYMGSSASEWLYYIKRTGFELPETAFKGACPEGAEYYVIREPDAKFPNNVRIHNCTK